MKLHLRQLFVIIQLTMYIVHDFNYNIKMICAIVITKSLANDVDKEVDKEFENGAFGASKHILLNLRCLLWTKQATLHLNRRGLAYETHFSDNWAGLYIGYVFFLPGNRHDSFRGMGMRRRGYFPVLGLR